MLNKNVNKGVLCKVKCMSNVEVEDGGGRKGGVYRRGWLRRPRRAARVTPR